MNFGVPFMEDGSVKRVINAIAPAQKRNYVIGQLTTSLCKGKRKDLLNLFQDADFDKKAVVIMGDPDKEYTERVHAALLADKKKAVEKERGKKAQELERKRLLEEKKKRAEEAKKA